MNPNDLGRRLLATRRACGLTRQAVADMLGLSRAAVTGIETGRRSVSTLELSNLARMYCRPVACFLQETEEGLVAGEDLLAALRGDAPGLINDRKVRERMNRCVNLCMEGVVLRSMLGLPERPGPPNYEIDVSDIAGEAVSRGRRAVGRQRHRTRTDNVPTPNAGELESWKELAEKHLDMLERVEASGRTEYPDRGLCGEITHLATEAYRRGVISRGRLLELGAVLEIREETLLDIAEGSRGN